MTERVRLHTPQAPKAKRRVAPRYMAFTEARVAGIRPKASAYLTWDRNDPEARKQESVPGLTVLTQTSGFKSYYAQFNLPHQDGRSIALGPVGEISLEEARQRTREIRRKARDGIDPRVTDRAARIEALKAELAKLQDEERAATVEEASRVTFAMLVDHENKEEPEKEGWYQTLKRKGNKSAKEAANLILFHTKDWHHRPALAITEQDIERLLIAICDGKRTLPNGKKARPQPPTANRLHAHLHTLFKWAVKKKKAGIEVSPMAAVDLPAPNSAKKSRHRGWFGESEADAVVAALWALAGTLGGDSEKFVKLAVLTGKRRTAIQTMRWEHISADWYWAPPKHLFSEQKKCNAIPLPKLAQRVLGARQVSGPVMGMSHTKGMSDTKVNQLMRTVRRKLELPAEVRERLGLPAEAQGLPDFLWHGCRHLFETRTGEIGVEPHIRDLLLDHAIARSQSGKGYDHGAYKTQLSAALELWASHVTGLVAPAEGVAVLR